MKKKIKRVKFTTTLSDDVIYKLSKMAPDYGLAGDKNIVIECLVRKEWRDKYEVETKDRDNKRTSDRDS